MSITYRDCCGTPANPELAMGHANGCPWVAKVREQRQAEREEAARRDAAALEYAKANPVTPEERAHLESILGGLI